MHKKTICTCVKTTHDICDLYLTDQVSHIPKSQNRLRMFTKWFTNTVKLESDCPKLVTPRSVREEESKSVRPPTHNHMVVLKLDVRELLFTSTGENV